MRRGELWTAPGGKDYAGKPRPVVHRAGSPLRRDRLGNGLCLHDGPTDAPLFRLPVEPNERNGLRAPGRLEVDKITTVPKTKLGALLGRLDDEAMLRLNQARLVFLG